MNTQQSEKNRKTLRLGIIIAILMFGFGFALVPLYNVLCTSIGINGKTRSEASALATANDIDGTRTITVHFVAANNNNLPFVFSPSLNEVSIHPGQNQRLYYLAKNLTQNKMVVQAIPSVSPSEAARYMKKTECFCFTQQQFGPNQTVQMPLLFHIDKGIDPEIHTITLSYTLFDAHQYVNPKNIKIWG
jgi:cytochrome c oxidase assembly protein subunit 11